MQGRQHGEASLLGDKIVNRQSLSPGTPWRALLNRALMEPPATGLSVHQGPERGQSAQRQASPWRPCDFL